MDNLKEVVAALAGGAHIELDDENYYELRLPAPKIDGETWTRLIHHGWLESMPNGGWYKLSDTGLRAYLRSTDEMGDGKLVDPTEYRP